MIIEPCCCHNQLPKLCKSNFDRLVTFHTNGDVTIEKILFAVGCLTGPSVFTLITPTLVSSTLDYLKYSLQRGWHTHTNILTAPIEGNKDILNTTEGITWIFDSRITESSSLFILEGQTRRLAITGYFPCLSPADTDNHYRLVNHTALFCDNISLPTSPSLRGRDGERLEGRDGASWKDLTYIPLSPFRIHSR